MRYSCILVLLIFSFNARSQKQTFNINLKPESEKFYFDSVPFNKVRVIDLRFDTVGFYINQQGTYPVNYYRFQSTASEEISDYIIKRTSTSLKGNKNLLIVIHQFRIPNKTDVLTRSKKNPNSSTRKSFGYYTLFSASIYFELGEGHLQEVASINKKYYNQLSELPVEATIQKVLDDVIRTVLLYENSAQLDIKKLPRKDKWILSDSATFRFAKPHSIIYDNQIRESTKEKWEKYPVVAGITNQKGVYKNFDDFREDKIDTTSFSFKYDEEDSVFRVSVPGMSKKERFYMPWAVIEYGKIFINIIGNVYVKATKQNGTFHFYIPYSLPDMYSLLSKEALPSKSGSSSASASQSLLGLLIVLVAEGIIDSQIKSSKGRKIMNEGYNHPFRYCYIDMDSGDIIYSDTH